MLLLAQFASTPDPAPIPDPPFLPHLLFESPWTTLLACTALGLAAFFALRRSGRDRHALIALVAALATGAGLYALATLVKTERELAQEQTLTLIAAVARADSAAVGNLLAPRVSVRIVGVLTPWSTDEVIQHVQQDMNGRFALKDRAASVRSMRACSDNDDAIRTQCRVTVTPEATAFPTGSWWLLTWRRTTTGAWRVTDIDLQQVDGLPPGSRID